MDLSHQTLLITGGTGSFGSTVLKRFLQTDIGAITVFSRDEKKQEDMRRLYPDPRIRFVLGDVRDLRSVEYAMRGVDYVFHAAALKQVPSCEFFPMEAVQTNVTGTDHVIRAAMQQGVKRLVLLSTDKAVYPINAMGISKAMAEKVLIAHARTARQADTVLCATRYGNVMASRGSVIPLFVEQLLAGQALTITDPHMTRFLMSLQESVDLVLHALEHGQQGDIFVQKSSACTVGVLAQAISELFKSQLDVKTIGTRHGEKLFETLVSREEMAKAEDLNRYWRIPADHRDLNYGLYESSGNDETSRAQDYTSHSTEQLSVEQVKTILLKLPYIQQQLGQRSAA
jgi:UDP-N-acetylglucosamine 4,6-dehydratase/5-epimerase